MVRPPTKTPSSASSTHPTNQLVKKISPFDELMMQETIPFDEASLDGREEANDRDHTEERRREIVKNDAHQVPKLVVFPMPEPDEGSELSLEVDLWKEKRSLTPHPSFDEIVPTATDFHHIFHTTTKKNHNEEQDWPSDEDRTVGKQDEEEDIGFAIWVDGDARHSNASGTPFMLVKNLDADPTGDHNTTTHHYQLI